MSSSSSLFDDVFVDITSSNALSLSSTSSSSILLAAKLKSSHPILSSSLKPTSYPSLPSTTPFLSSPSPSSSFSHQKSSSAQSSSFPATPDSLPSCSHTSSPPSPFISHSSVTTITSDTNATLPESCARRYFVSGPSRYEVVSRQLSSSVSIPRSSRSRSLSLTSLSSPHFHFSITLHPSLQHSPSNLSLESNARSSSYPSTSPLSSAARLTARSRYSLLETPFTDEPSTNLPSPSMPSTPDRIARDHAIVCDLPQIDSLSTSTTHNVFSRSVLHDIRGRLGKSRERRPMVSFDDSVTHSPKISLDAYYHVNPSSGSPRSLRKDSVSISSRYIKENTKCRESDISILLRQSTNTAPVNLGVSCDAISENSDLSNYRRDRFGFLKTTPNITQQEYDAWDEKYSVYLTRRHKRWTDLMEANGLCTRNPQTFPARCERIKRFVRKGIPPEWRGAAWFWYAGGLEKHAHMRGTYDKLLRRFDELEHEKADPQEGCRSSSSASLCETDMEHIERDLYRTFPDNVWFKPGAVIDDNVKLYLTTCGAFQSGSGTFLKRWQVLNDNLSPLSQEPPMVYSLRRVLRAFSLLRPEIGYCQSLNFIAGLLLLFLQGDEEKTFVMLDVITTDYLPGTHARVLEANVDVGVLMDLLRKELPCVWKRIKDDGTGGGGGGGKQTMTTLNSDSPIRSRTKKKPFVESKFRGAMLRLPTVSLATTSWFMSLFVGSLPIETVLRIWDCLFYEGPKVLFRASLAIFKLGENRLTHISDPLDALNVVQALPRSIIDANLLLDTCWRRRRLRPSGGVPATVAGFSSLGADVIEFRRRKRRRMLRDEANAKNQAVGDSKKKNRDVDPELAALRREARRAGAGLAKDAGVSDAGVLRYSTEDGANSEIRRSAKKVNGGSTTAIVTPAMFSGLSIAENSSNPAIQFPQHHYSHTFMGLRRAASRVRSGGYRSRRI